MANQIKKVVITMGVRGRLYRQENEQIMMQNALVWRAPRKQAIVKWPSAMPAALPIPQGKGMAMGIQ
jgi:hypothetical protein